MGHCQPKRIGGSKRIAMAVSIFALTVAAAAAQEGLLSGPGTLIQVGADQKEALEVAESIYMGIGFGNTYLVTTPEGNAVIDTSLPEPARRHRRLLGAVSDAPVRAIILTHGHGDHRGGVPLWKQEGTEVIAQSNYVELRHYQSRLAEFFGRRNVAQFGGFVPAGAMAETSADNFGAEIEATVLVDDLHTFELGGLTFEIHATPGETYDALSVWIPERRAAFVGDNFYGSFPNMYTLRGTKPRWALDYVASLEKVLSWEPEVLLPSHGPPIKGKEEIRRQVERYRDAILYVHDATVRGMNAGKDVFTLMQEINLPPDLDVGQGYGNLPWSVRGIYEGYIGWFDGNPSSMYAVPPRTVYADVVELAGTGAVLRRARARLAAGEAVEALHLVDMVLEVEPASHSALELRIAALETLAAASTNSNEQGWLQSGIGEAKARLER